MAKKPASKAEREHMARVAALGCICPVGSGRCCRPAELHHLRTGMGMGQRASSFDCLPLCHHHHRTGGYGEAIHSGSKTWQILHGTELELLETVKRLLDNAKGDTWKI